MFNKFRIALEFVHSNLYVMLLILIFFYFFAICKTICSKVDAFDMDRKMYPKFQKTEYIEVEQNSGELLVIPSGWFHQVTLTFLSVFYALKIHGVHRCHATRLCIDT